MSGLSLLAPWSLLALVPLAGIIVLLYLLRLRRRETVVPSVFLWRRAVEDVQANAPFQRLRPNLLLILQLLALALMVAGLAAPYVMARRLSGRASVVVVDTSASMCATDEAGSRLDEARRRAVEIIRAMTGRDEVALVECSARAKVLVPLTRERRELLAATAQVSPTDCPGNIRDGLLLAMSLCSRRPDATIYLISDGAFGELSDLRATADVRFIPVGRRSDNLALLALEASRPAGSGAYQLFVRLRSYSDRPRQCVLSIYHEDELLDARRLTLQPGEDRAETWEATIREAGLLRAELEADDDLPADNVAYASVIPPAGLSVLLVTPGNLFLEQALMVLPEVEVFKAGELTASGAEEAYGRYDLVVFDRVPAPAAPQRGAVMMIAAGGWPELAEPVGRLVAPAITTWDRQHPALQHVNLGAVSIAEGQVLAPGPAGAAIAQAGDDPMVVTLDAPELRGLAFGMSFLDTDMPLRVGFPVLLSNAVRWLTGVRDRHGLQTARPGETLTAATPPEASGAELILPGGERRKLDASGGQVVFADTDRVGVYELRAGDQRRRWAVDLRDPAESELAPRAEVRLGGRGVAGGAGQLRAERHFWPWLAGLALLGLLIEWHVFHRRY